MNNYFSKFAANLSNKENNESNLTTLLKNLPDENYDQSHDFCTPPFTYRFGKVCMTFCYHTA